MNKRRKGEIIESLVCDFIAQQGAVIVEKNYRCRQGEVDIIARDDRYLCFIEVKFRYDTRFGQPQEAVTPTKQKHICNVSKFYLYSKYKSLDVPVRYDVIAVSPQDDIYICNWIKNAFDYR